MLSGQFGISRPSFGSQDPGSPDVETVDPEVDDMPSVVEPVVAEVVVTPVVSAASTQTPAEHMSPASQPPPPVHMHPSAPISHPEVDMVVDESVVVSDPVSPEGGLHATVKRAERTRGSADDHPFAMM